MSLPWLDDSDLTFPPIESALDEPNGLLAVGGDLSAERLIVAYRQGIFPWYEEGGPILWWSPSPRSVILPGEMYVSRSLRKKLKSGRFQVTCNNQFEAVINACSEARAYTTSTWITPYMMESYKKLHQLAYAHSIEVWEEEDLVGGLYGISIGKIFFGESMFHKVTDASKIAFAHLCRLLQSAGFPLIDCQVENEHINSLGAIEMSREKFKDYLSRYTNEAPPLDLWKPKRLESWS